MFSEWYGVTEVGRCAGSQPLHRHQIFFHNATTHQRGCFGQGDGLERAGRPHTDAQQGIRFQPQQHRHLHCVHGDARNLLRRGGDECDVVDENPRARRTRARKAQPLRAGLQRNLHPRLERAPHHHGFVAIKNLHPFAVELLLHPKRKRRAVRPSLGLENQMPRHLDGSRWHKLHSPVFASENVQALFAGVMMLRRHLRVPRRRAPRADRRDQFMEFTRLGLLETGSERFRSSRDARLPRHRSKPSDAKPPQCCV